MKKILIFLAIVLPLLVVSLGFIDKTGNSDLALAEDFLELAEELFKKKNYYLAGKTLHDAEVCIAEALGDRASVKHGMEDRIKTLRNYLNTEFAVLYIKGAEEAIDEGNFRIGIMALGLAKEFVRKINKPEAEEGDSFLADIEGLEDEVWELIDKKINKHKRNFEEDIFTSKLLWNKI